MMLSQFPEFFLIEDDMFNNISVQRMEDGTWIMYPTTLGADHVLRHIELHTENDGSIRSATIETNTGDVASIFCSNKGGYIELFQDLWEYDIPSSQSALREINQLDRFKAGEITQAVLTRSLMIEGFKIRGLYDPSVHDNMTDEELSVAVQAQIMIEMRDEQGFTDDDFAGLDVDQMLTYVKAIKLLSAISDAMDAHPRRIMDNGEEMEPGLSSVLNKLQKDVDPNI